MRRALFGLGVATAASAAAVAVSAVVLALGGYDPIEALIRAARFGARDDSLASAANRMVPLYLSGLAAAVAFRAGLFNIGVEGQYRIGALAAAAVAAAVSLPAAIHLPLCVIAAVGAGAAWAGVAAALAAWRGVNEVIATIMLNVVAGAVVAEALGATGPIDIPATARIPAAGSVFGVALPPGSAVGGFAAVAVVAGVAAAFVLFTTGAGFRLRSFGANPKAAAAAGVDGRRVTWGALLVSGGLAGVVGLPAVLGDLSRLDADLPAGLGFTGIAVALVGRNHPVGIAGAAGLFAFLERAAQGLDLAGVPRQVVFVTEATVLLAVVVAYVAADRVAARSAASAVAR